MFVIKGSTGLLELRTTILVSYKIDSPALLSFPVVWSYRFNYNLVPPEVMNE